MSYPNSPFTGFPFEDDFEDRNFRSQLDDIAQRHPEFAQHLNFDHRFPSTQPGRRRRGSDERTQPPPENRRFERPFRSRFEDFRFSPFSDRDFEGPGFNREDDFLSQEPFQQYREFEQPGQQQREFYREQPQREFQPHREPEREVQKESPKEEVEEFKDNNLKKNIQQSNTVDLGKNQEPVDDQRGQRSMSAPPENRPRFVSSINIPVQGLHTVGGGGGEQQMGGRTSQPEKPMERVIPIHVEGRDEPVLPKNPNFTSNQQSQQHQQQQHQQQHHHQQPHHQQPHHQQPHHQQQHQQQPERIFGRNPSHFTQFLNKEEPDDLFKQQQRSYQQKQKENYQQQQQQQQNQQHQQEPSHFQQQEQEQPKQQQTHHEEKKKPLTQLDQIQNIQKDVSELMNRVEKFNGKPKDKEYLYLDEMLTRNLIKLDNIETEGKDNIRQARKEAIKCIEGCIGILEAKANANLTKETTAVEGDQQQQSEQENEIVQDVNEQKNEVVDEKIEENQANEQVGQKDEVEGNEKKCDDLEKSGDELKKGEDKVETEKDVPGSSLEVSGVARSGSLVVEGQGQSPTPMDVVESGENVKKENVGDDKDKEASTKTEEKKEKKKTTKKKEKVDKK